MEFKSHTFFQVKLKCFSEHAQQKVFSANVLLYNTYTDENKLGAENGFENNIT